MWSSRRGSQSSVPPAATSAPRFGRACRRRALAAVVAPNASRIAPCPRRATPPPASNARPTRSFAADDALSIPSRGEPARRRRPSRRCRQNRRGGRVALLDELGLALLARGGHAGRRRAGRAQGRAESSSRIRLSPGRYILRRYLPWPFPPVAATSPGRYSHVAVTARGVTPSSGRATRGSTRDGTDGGGGAPSSGRRARGGAFDTIDLIHTRTRDEVREHPARLSRRPTLDTMCSHEPRAALSGCGGGCSSSSRAALSLIGARRSARAVCACTCALVRAQSEEERACTRRRACTRGSRMHSGTCTACSRVHRAVCSRVHRRPAASARSAPSAAAGDERGTLGEAQRGARDAFGASSAARAAQQCNPARTDERAVTGGGAAGCGDAHGALTTQSVADFGSGSGGGAARRQAGAALAAARVPDRANARGGVRGGVAGHAWSAPRRASRRAGESTRSERCWQGGEEGDDAPAWARIVALAADGRAPPPRRARGRATPPPPPPRSLPCSRSCEGGVALVSSIKSRRTPPWLARARGGTRRSARA